MDKEELSDYVKSKVQKELLKIELINKSGVFRNDTTDDLGLDLSEVYEGPEAVKDAQNGIDYSLNQQKLAVKVLTIAYNSQITKLLKESIIKSQEIDRLRARILELQAEKVKKKETK
jgi:hypothetical protein